MFGCGCGGGVDEGGFKTERYGGGDEGGVVGEKCFLWSICVVFIFCGGDCRSLLCDFCVFVYCVCGG